MNNLKKIRTDAGISIADLVVSSGMTKQSIIRYEHESNSALPNLRAAYVISAVLGVSVYDIWPDKTEIVEEVITIRRVKS